MKKLEDFECEKVEIKNVYGGKIHGNVTYCALPDGRWVEEGIDE